MSERTLSRLAAILMIVVLLFWNSFPIISYAGSFITPGKPITPGKALTPGQPIKGGQFIIPGQVYNPGKPIAPGEAAVPGKTGGTSGQPILPKSPYQNGAFIIPNAPPVPPGSLYWQLRNLETGGALQGGTPINGGNSSIGGQGPSGGQGISGGQGANGGQSINGGQGPNGGKGINGGQGPNGGRAQNGGQGINGGHGSNGGQSINGGQAPNGGLGVNGGHGPNGGQGTNDVQGVNGGSGGDGTSSGSSGNNNSIHDNISKGFNILDLLKTIPTKANEVLNGSIAWALGFSFSRDKRIIQNPDATTKTITNYRINGKSKMKTGKTKIEKWLNENIEKRYYDYLKNLKNNSTILKTPRGMQESVLRATKKISSNSFKKFMTENFSIKGALKSDFLDNWSFKGSNFWSPKNWIKGNGFANVLISTGGTIYDYTVGEQKGKIFSTDFAAALSTDISLGLTTTAVSAGAGWAAAAIAGGTFGSVIPGLGTVIGAGVGIVASLFLVSNSGKKFKEKVKKAFKWLYDGLVPG
jgi:hypothetical protein